MYFLSLALAGPPECCRRLLERPRQGRRLRVARLAGDDAKDSLGRGFAGRRRGEAPRSPESVPAVLRVPAAAEDVEKRASDLALAADAHLPPRPRASPRMVAQHQKPAPQTAEGPLGRQHDLRGSEGQGLR